MIEKEQPIEDVLVKLMNDIGHIIGGALRDATKNSKERYGFALLMFGLTGSESSRMNYLANVEREDMVVALKEFIARIEGRYELAPGERMIDPSKKRQQ